MPVTSKRVAPTTSAVTVIWFSVSVPVLSEQITVVLPSVSTAGRRRISAPRRAMVDTPTASRIVTAAGNPSGIAPTASATAASKVAAADAPRATSSANMAAVRARIDQTSRRDRPAIRRVSGVASWCVLAMRSAIFPVSVASPTATTTPRACP
jgi:hypothetical protein